MEKDHFRYIKLYAFAYAALGVMLPLLGQYLAEVGFSGTQIGSITASGTGMAIVTAAFWGNRYNRSSNPKRLLLGLYIMAASVCMVLVFVKGYGIFLLLFCGLYFFQAPATAFLDAISIGDGQPFGKVRKWGAAGFALGVFIAGKLSESFGLALIFPLYAAGFFICSAVLFPMSRGMEGKGRAVLKAGEECHTTEERTKVQGKTGLIQNRKYMKIILCAFFLCGTNVANNIYFGFLFTQGGGSVAGIGIAFLLMAGSEMPFMGWSVKLANHFTLEKMLLMAMCVSAARFAWYGTCPPATILLATFFLQGIVNGIMLVEFVRYVAKVVEPQLLGMATVMYYAIGSSLSTILCQLVGGALLDFYGPGGIYLFFAAMNGVGVILYVQGGLHRAGSNKPDLQ